MTNTNTLTNPGRFLTLALTKVESESIRKWARAQRPAWTKLAALWLAGRAGGEIFGKRDHESEADHVCRFAGYIVATAIGM